MSKNIAVIGAGFGGLSAAAYLAKAGYKVTVYEKNPQPGGRAMILKKKGFTFDLGPSWYMMPDVFDDFFADFDKKVSDFYDLKKLNPSYRVYTNTEHHDVKNVKGGGLKLFDDLEPGSAQKMEAFLNQTQKEYAIIRKHLLEKNYIKSSDLIDKQILGFLTKPELARPYHNRVKKTVKNEDLQKILEFMVVFMGGSPQNIPAVYSLLAHVDFNLGIWYPMGGFGAVVSSFEKLAKDLGVNIVYDAEVKQINTSNGLAKSLVVNGQKEYADIVLANADYYHTESKLLDIKDQSYSKSYWRSRTLSPSAVLVYLGINKKVPGLLHHTMFFDADWHGHFNNVFKQKQWVTRPLFYVGTPSKTDPTIAPKDQENIVILVPTASGLKVDKDHRDELVSSVIARMEARIGSKFSQDIVVKEVIDGQFFKDTFNAYRGNAFGLAHTLKQTAPLRPRMQSKKVKNLYYVGQYTNPGTGVPMVVLSGKVVANLIKESHKP